MFKKEKVPGHSVRRLLSFPLGTQPHISCFNGVGKLKFFPLLEKKKKIWWLCFNFLRSKVSTTGPTTSWPYKRLLVAVFTSTNRSDFGSVPSQAVQVIQLARGSFPWSQTKITSNKWWKGNLVQNKKDTENSLGAKIEESDYTKL